MSEIKVKNMITDENTTRVSNTSNDKVVVKFTDLKEFIITERGGSLYGMANLIGYNPGTFSNTLRGVGRLPSSIVVMLRLEKHYGIVIEGDPYR